MDKLLEIDLINRVNSIYKCFQNLVKEYLPDKWYASSLEFEIKDSKEINGKSWCEKDKDHIEINRVVYGYKKENIYYFNENGLMEL